MMKLKVAVMVMFWLACAAALLWNLYQLWLELNRFAIGILYGG
jgi:hypothetical protein